MATAALRERPAASPLHAFQATEEKKIIERNGIKMYPAPVPGPIRDGDRRSTEPFLKTARPSFFGELLLNRWFGNSARKAGLYWPKREELRALDAHLEHYGDEIKNNDVVYPEYYCQPFHGYNSNFASDAVAQQASAMAVVPAIMTGAVLSSAFDERLRRLQTAINIYKRYQGPESVAQTQRVLDIGGGTGVTTRLLARAYPQAQVINVDMSAPMLVLAKASTDWPPDVFTTTELEQLCLKDNPQDLAPRLTWLHDNAENTRLVGNQMDLCTAHFIAHELPESAMRNIAGEAFRVLRKGGWFAVIDTDQNVKNLHRGPELMRRLAGVMAREPHLHEYLRADLGAMMADAGFTCIDEVDEAAALGCTLYVGQKPL